MTTSRLITRSACALGAAILATTALQSTPADARAHASGRARVSAHSVGHKVSSRISQELPGQHSLSSGGGGGGGTPQSKPGDGGRPVPPGGIPGNGPRIPAGGGGKQFPTTGLPTTGPINPGSLPGNRPTEQTPTPPVVTGSNNNPGPIPPVLNPKVPGTKQPPGPKPVPPPGSNTGPNFPDYPGGNRPPILTGTPTRAPIPPITSGGTPPTSTMPSPIPSGSSPSPGYGTGATYTHQYSQGGVYADVGAGGESYEPCQWFKSNYDVTGNVYWLRRYRICLWTH
jgi:hypothetical protein